MIPWSVSATKYPVWVNQSRVRWDVRTRLSHHTSRTMQSFLASPLLQSTTIQKRRRSLILPRCCYNLRRTTFTITPQWSWWFLRLCLSFGQVLLPLGSSSRRNVALSACRRIRTTPTPWHAFTNPARPNITWRKCNKYGRDCSKKKSK